MISAETQPRPRRRLTNIAEQQATRDERDKLQQSWAAINQLDWYPLDSPGMPAPGTDFIRRAADLGDDTEIVGTGKKQEIRTIGRQLEKLYRRAMRDRGFMGQMTIKKGREEVVPFVPGHLWGEQYIVDGPVPAKVMVIGKMPGELEVAKRRNFIGKTGDLLREKAETFEAARPDDWYVTNACKFPAPKNTELKEAWIKQCLPILHQELRLVRPQYILCLGADASKTLLGDKYNVAYMMGRVEELTYPIHIHGQHPLNHTALVMTVLHPAAVLRFPEREPELDQGMARWAMLLDGIRFDREEQGIEHYEIRTEAELLRVLEIAEQEKLSDWVAVDAEWEGQHPVNEGSYVRTVQWSWAPKRAACIIVREAGGGLVSADWEDIVRKHMRRYFSKKRVAGHFFNSDLEFLVAWGLDLRQQFLVPRPEKGKPPAFIRTKTEGGMDTGIAFHAIEETADFGLEMLTLRYTTAPRYDVSLYDWKVRRAKELEVPLKGLEGYGNCPDSILCPYGCYDADVTYRLLLIADRLLDKGHHSESSREAYWRNMGATPAVLEIHQTGIQLDQDRVDLLTGNFMTGRDRLAEGIRRWAKWPDFNIRSVFQVRELLFGEQLNGKDRVNDQAVRLRPPGARCLRLQPILDTSKRPRRWEEVVAAGEQYEANASTNKLSLSILAQDNPHAAKQVLWLRDYRFVDQVLKSILKPPDIDEDTGDFVFGDDGDLEYSGGLAAALCDDGRIRTHIYQVKETGRWSSARPPLQNISKRRDADYIRILGADNYKHKLRSLLRSTPKGGPGAWCDEDTVLIEADYTGAELCGMAWMSGDRRMIEHARRNLLPEDHPDYYDIHSNIAVSAFGLKCEPTKKGLKNLKVNKDDPDDPGHSHLRIVAKSVIFGVAYGRGAKAVALAAREEGISITVEQAEAVIEAIFMAYPGLVPFFAECRERAVDPGWLCSCFRRYRRFGRSDEFAVIGEFERQAMNFPIQSMIADAMNIAIANLYWYRQEIKDPNMYRIVLQIHDAVMLEVPYSRVKDVIRKDGVLDTCMVKRVPIYPSTLTGKRKSDQPHRLGIQVEVCQNWGEEISEELLDQLGIRDEPALAH